LITSIAVIQFTVQENSNEIEPYVNSVNILRTWTKLEPAVLKPEPNPNPVFDNFARTRTEPNQTISVLEPEQKPNPSNEGYFTSLLKVEWQAIVLCSAVASLNQPHPWTTAISPQFSGDFFSRHTPEQQPSYHFRRLLIIQFSSAWALYVALSSLIHGLSLPVRPFQGQLYTAMGPFFPVSPSRSEGSGVDCAGSAVLCI